MRKPATLWSISRIENDAEEHGWLFGKIMVRHGHHQNHGPCNVPLWENSGDERRLK